MKKRTTKFLKNAVAPSRAGRFTAWCKQNGFPGVTNACIAEAQRVAKKTGNTALLREANFAATANRKGGFAGRKKESNA